MGIALTLQEYLDDHHVPYDVMLHKRTHCAFDTARATPRPGRASRQGRGADARGRLRRRRRSGDGARAPRRDRAHAALPVELATEDEISELFPDCELGAVPPIPEAYAVDAFVDESFDKQPDVYLEGGDHRSLVHMTGEAFRSIMQDVRRARIAA